MNHKIYRPCKPIVEEIGGMYEEHSPTSNPPWVLYNPVKLEPPFLECFMESFFFGKRLFRSS